MATKTGGKNGCAVGCLAGLGGLMLVAMLGYCADRADRVAEEAADEEMDAPPYVASVPEEPGAAVAIVLDNSGSMEDEAPGDTRSKHEMALEAIEQVLQATDSLARERPDFPVSVGVYVFSDVVKTVLPMAPYDRARVSEALAQVSEPGGATAIGTALDHARRELYASGRFRKYVVVVTDGENTDGRSPDRVAREIARRSEGGVQVYFVAFDTDPEKFGFLRETGGGLLAAASGAELKQTLGEVYRERILAEAADSGGGAPPAAPESATTTPEAGTQ